MIRRPKRDLFFVRIGKIIVIRSNWYSRNDLGPAIVALMQYFNANVRVVKPPKDR
jgi:hypothetical protein